MAKKYAQQKPAVTRAAPPPGVKPSTRRISRALRKMIMEDRGVASGGRNVVERSRTATAR